MYDDFGSMSRWRWRSGLKILLFIFALIELSYTKAFKLGGIIQHDDSFLDDLKTFPHALDVTITHNNRQILLELEKNTYLDINVPGVVINKDGEGERIPTTNQKNFQPYQDVASGAAITLSCIGVERRCQPVLVGSYFHEDFLYQLEPVEDIHRLKRSVSSSSSPRHHVYRRAHPNTEKSELEPEPVTIQIKPGRRKRRRTRRQRVPDNIVEILLVLDYEIYKRFNQSIPAAYRTRDEVYNTIKQYIFQVFNGMDLRYNDIRANDFSIRIRLSDFIIAEEKRFSPWTENYVRNGTVDVTEVLKPFAETKEEIQRQYGLSPFDHAMAMSGFDLIFENKKTTLGYAYLNTTCQYWSVSFVEDRNDIMKTIWTASHELGHSLCSLHDGIQNRCKSHRKYIMTSTIDKPSRLTPQNPWKFSQCSVQYFREMLQKLDKQPINCLRDTSPPNFFGKTEWVNHTSSHFGSLYNQDEQCQRIHGDRSYMCRDKVPDARRICTNLWCHRIDPETGDSECTPHLAAAGTTCGNKMWCQRGQCVFNQAAVPIGSCPFGDQPGILALGASCENTVRDNPGMCQHPEFNLQCCRSCQNDTSIGIRVDRGTASNPVVDDVIVPGAGEITRTQPISSTAVRINPSHSLGSTLDIGYSTHAPPNSGVYQAPPQPQPEPQLPPIVSPTAIPRREPSRATGCHDTGSPFNQVVVGCRGFKTFCYLAKVKRDCCATCQRPHISPARMIFPIDRSRRRRQPYSYVLQHRTLLSRQKRALLKIIRRNIVGSEAIPVPESGESKNTISYLNVAHDDRLDDPIGFETTVPSSSTVSTLPVQAGGNPKSGNNSRTDPPQPEVEQAVPLSQEPVKPDIRISTEGETILHKMIPDSVELKKSQHDESSTQTVSLASTTSKKLAASSTSVSKTLATSSTAMVPNSLKSSTASSQRDWESTTNLLVLRSMGDGEVTTRPKGGIIVDTQINIGLFTDPSREPPAVE